MASATLTYDKMMYSPYALNNAGWTERELRKEYSRLRSIARKRLERFKGTEWEQSQSYQKNIGKYKAIADIHSTAELKKLLTDVAYFVDASTGSVSGLKQQRDRAIATFNERGYDFVNKSNFKDFLSYLEDMRSTKLASIYDSDQLSEVYEVARAKGFTTQEVLQDFDFWYKNRKKLDAMEIITDSNGNAASAAEYRMALKGY